MSVKRYRPFLNQQGGRYVPSMDCPSMKEDDRGEWVSLADYATLKAEVERLRKAGDEMAKRTEFFQKRWDADELCQEVEAWNAAKEGKPSV